jgi:hypothetical protein
VSGDDGAEAGRGTDPVPTARSVDSSISSCPQVAVGCVGTVPRGPEPVEGVGWGPVVPTALPDDATAPADAQRAPCGHGVGAGSVPTGVQAAALMHPPVVLVVDR